MNENPVEEVKSVPEKSVEAGDAGSAKSEESGGNQMFMMILIVGVVLVVLVSVLIYFLGISKKDEIQIEDLTITQPFVENNEFRSFVLGNGLSVLLAKSNDGMENSFVSLSVGVGSQTDPKDFCGFTHLIEHLLFTGSAHYPEDDYIVKVINKHNGEDNGVTKSFTTSYYYKIGKGGLSEFSAVLADAVAFPNFDADKIKKELNNVNSEISMRMTFNKNLGYYKMIKKIGNPDARIFRDGFANIDADKQDFNKLHEYIQAFHKKYYSANIMTLAIITDEDLNQVESIVRKEFEIIPNKQVVRPTHEHETPYEPPFLPTVYNNVYYMQGFSKPSQLNLIFEVNSERKYHRFHGLEYFSFFLNYYSANSLKDKLIREDLITGFDDELTLSDYKRGIYMVQFDLTEKGETHLSHIIVEFFRFVDFIRNLDITDDLYRQGSNFSKFAFLFNISSEFLMFPEVEQDNFQRVLEFSEKMQDYPINTIFTANQVWKNFNKTRFEQVLIDLEIEKMVVMVESEKFQITDEDDVIGYDINWINGKDKTFKQVDDRADQMMQDGISSDRSNGHTHLRRLQQMRAQLPPDSKAAQLLDRHSQAAPAQAGPKQTRHAKVAVDEAAQQESDEGRALLVYKENFLDNCIEYIKLLYSLDFDNNKRFTFESIPPDIIKKYKKEIAKDKGGFDRIGSLDIEDSMRYDMVTNCSLPDDLSGKKGPVDDIKRQNTLANASKLDSEEENEQHQLKIDNQQYLNNVNLVRIFEVLFNESMEEHVLTQKMLIIRSLLVYKICLIDEFDKDDEVIQAELISETPRVKNYFKMYRKTLQPKSAIRVMVENPYFQDNILRGTSESKQQFYLRVELLCLYIKHYLTLNFYKDFVGGNDMSVSSHSYAIYFTFIGLSIRVGDFMEKMLGEIEKLLDPKNYDKTILRNLQTRIVNNYSNYDSMTSLKLSTYLLDLMIDELTMDIRTQEDLARIGDWVNSITPKDLAETLAEIQSQNKLTVLEAGNYNKDFAIKKTETVKKFLLKDEKDESIRPENLFSQSINRVLDNMLLRFGGENHHFMVRMPNLDPEDNNSVYVTYFRSEKETVKIKLIGTMVSHWMRAFVFDRLRNQQNLGYVAYESIREYYFRTGQMILVQGEKFRPTEIEDDIETTIKDFFEELKAKTADEVEGLKSVILQNYTEFTNSLEDVTSKLWDFIEEEYILDEKQDYETIAGSISLKDMTDYYQSTFFDNQRRITLQLFAHELKPEEASFKLDKSKQLIDLEYQIKSLDEMIQLRKDSVKTFKRNLREVKESN